MMVDLSGVVGERLEKTLAKARGHAERGEMAQAATAYAQAASLAEKYADAASSPQVRQKRLTDAKRLLRYAEQLKHGKLEADTPGQASECLGDGQIAEQKGEYLENARSLITQAKVSWDDIAGLDDIKRFVKESYALTVARRPDGVGLPRAANLLLYGPPGTGKTLIAAAVSKGLEATFFSCKISDMLSKYFGESSKLIDAIFALAEQKAPSVIFLDDFESIVPSRDGDSSGPERRVLTELLTCMDGFASKSSDRLVLVIAATNKPWLIDSAILSRFGKLAYVGLPEQSARRRIFELLLTQKGYTMAGSVEAFAEKTDGYSGRELEQIAKELIRKMISKANPDLIDLAEQGKAALQNYTLKVQPITPDDLEATLKTMPPMTHAAELIRYERWTKQ